MKIYAYLKMLLGIRDKKYVNCFLRGMLNFIWYKRKCKCATLNVTVNFKTSLHPRKNSYMCRD